MDSKATGTAAILLAVGVLTCAQIAIKGRLNVYGAFPFSLTEAPPYLLALMSDGRLWVGLIGLVTASGLWYAGISHLPLSQAYGFTALTYPLIFTGSILFLREPFSWTAFLGNALIFVGVLILAGARTSS